VAALRTGRNTGVVRREPGLAGLGINKYRERTERLNDGASTLNAPN
jgi:hypothetical protein